MIAEANEMPLEGTAGDDGCVARDEDAPSHDVEFLDADPSGVVGEDDALPAPAHRWPKWLPLPLAAVGVAVVTTLVVQVNSKPSASPPTHRPTTIHSSISAPGTSPTASSPRAPAPPVAVTEIGHPLLGVTAGWELFARGEAVVIRIQLARGRITTTAVPALSSNPVSFVIGSDRVLARPWDSSPGYLVPDGKQARDPPATLDKVGPAFPGPDLNHIWLPASGPGPDRMALVGLDGRSAGSIAVPAGSSARQAISDGGGYLLFTGLSGTYDARPTGVRRITTGAVLAAGPTGWLISECDDNGRCTTVAIDRTSGARHTLHRIASDANIPPPGVISPDGTTAALIDVTEQTTAIHLRDLTTGADHPLSVPINQGFFDDGSLVWSPDSRWLFIAAANGRIAAIDAHTRQARDLGIPLPNLSQIAVRSVPAN